MSAWIEIAVFAGVYAVVVVALLVSAWIEMLENHFMWIYITSRTPRECVD